MKKLLKPILLFIGILVAFASLAQERLTKEERKKCTRSSEENNDRASEKPERAF